MILQTSPARWRLGQLLHGLTEVAPAEDRTITGLASDSREVTRGALFFACPGSHTNGAEHIESAIARGAEAVVVEQSLYQHAARHPVPILPVFSAVSCAGAVANRFYGQPSQALRVIGVTGTNGKTTVTHAVAEALTGWSELGGETALHCGLIGTLGYGLSGDLSAGARTTPDVLTIHRLLARIRELGGAYVAMEVSSHALVQQRIAAVDFHTAVFTNLSRDHLDYHRSMEAYGAAKRQLFHVDGLRYAVINVSDEFGRRLASELPSQVQALCYGFDGEGGEPDVSAEVLTAGRHGLALRVSTPWGQGELYSRLYGRFNASNLLASLGVLLAGGMPLETALRRLGAVAPVPGRMEAFGGDDGNPLVVVDYAHSPEALRCVLSALREQCAGRLWCVFGCGGERDRGKRALMGAVAADEADSTVLTDDNPRGEDGDRIIAEVMAGVPSDREIIVERDRATAVRHAVVASRADDVVLVAGKGHECYQEIGAVRRPYSDRAAVRNALRERAQ
jgi:UDP-N-acetylmuramoyl-L-alanyl-D-glutamate--2,6-diaminopimelate ligase